MIRKNIIKKNIILLIIILLFSQLSWADNSQVFDVKELKESGQISSLENILDKLSKYDISRLLEIELKQADSRQVKHQFIYEIEYINGKGIVLEIEVDALTAQVLSIEREH